MTATDPVRRAVEQQRARVARYRDDAHHEVERLSLRLQEAIDAAAYHGRELAALDAFLAEHPEPAGELCAMAPYARDETGRFHAAGAPAPTPARREAFAPLGR